MNINYLKLKIYFKFLPLFQLEKCYCCDRIFFKIKTNHHAWCNRSQTKTISFFCYLLGHDVYYFQDIPCCSKCGYLNEEDNLVSDIGKIITKIQKRIQFLKSHFLIRCSICNKLEYLFGLEVKDHYKCIPF